MEQFYRREPVMNAFASHSVVVGVDGSEASRRAVMFGGVIAAKWRSTVSLVHALPQDGPIYSPAAIMLESQFLSQLREDGEAIVAEAESLLHGKFPQLELESIISPGPSHTAILEVSDAARVVVLGSKESGGFRSALLGSTALHVANHASCPVIVLRGDVESPDHRPVVVGVDGSGLSRKAVEHAFEYAAYFDAPIRAVHTWQGSPSWGLGRTSTLVDWKAVEEEETALLSEALAGVCERFPDVTVTKIAEQGAAADTMLEHSTDAQLIAVGSHGRNSVLGALMGSTSQNLLHHAACPIMICRS